MSFRINTNFAALTAHSSAVMHEKVLHGAMTRLSSGLRINSPEDDPSGLISSENFRTQLGGLDAAVRNNQDAVSYSKTAEAALAEVNQLLNDARALIVEAGNSATLTATQIQARQDQLASIASNITRISQSAQFGSKRLLDGSAGIQAQVSAGNEVLGISLSGTFNGATITTQALMTLNGISPGSQANVTSSALPGGVVMNAGTFSINGSSFTFTAGSTGPQVAATVNAAAASTGVTAAWNGATNQLDFTSLNYGQNTVLTFSDASGVISTGPPVTVTGTNPVAKITLGGLGTVLFTGGRAGTDGLALADAEGNIVQLTSAGNMASSLPLTIGQITPGSAVFQFGGGAGQTAQLALPNIASTMLGSDVVTNLNMSNIDITTSSNVANALAVVDRAIAQISNTRGQIGQFSSYVLDSNNRTLQSAKENMSAAESSIRDVDVASEMTTYTTAQVLQQSGLAMLAQANSMPQTVLALLKG